MLSKVIQYSTRQLGVRTARKRKKYTRAKSSVSHHEYFRKQQEATRWNIAYATIAAAGVGLYFASLWWDDYRARLEAEGIETKQRVVILGSGWAALSMLTWLNPYKYDVTIVSPRNYFLWSPLLSETIVGAVHADTITEPIRRYSNRQNKPCTFLEACCNRIDAQARKITCGGVCSGEQVELEYDKLIIAIGAGSSQKSVPGAEKFTLPYHDIQDCVTVRNKLIDCLEQASMPGVPEDKRKELLNFVIIGGSPIAMELAAALYDYSKRELLSSYPEVAEDIQITLVSSREHINNIYDSNITKWARSNYLRDRDINVVRSPIHTIASNTITFKPEQAGEKASEPVNYTVAVWSRGRMMHPLAQQLANTVGKNVQTNGQALIVDTDLSVKGTKDIYAIGDCATIDQGALVERWEKIFETLDSNGDGVVSPVEFQELIQTLGRQFPAILEIGKEANDLFELADKNKDGQLELSELKDILSIVDKRLTRLPTTAAVAAQEGKFLAQAFNKNEFELPPKERSGFRYKHIGGYEYVGAEDGFVERGSKSTAIINGPGAWWLWRCTLYSNMVGMQMRLTYVTDWVSSKLFGADATRL